MYECIVLFTIFIENCLFISNKMITFAPWKRKIPQRPAKRSSQRRQTTMRPASARLVLFVSIVSTAYSPVTNPRSASISPASTFAIRRCSVKAVPCFAKTRSSACPSNCLRFITTCQAVWSVPSRTILLMSTPASVTTNTTTAPARSPLT